MEKKFTRCAAASLFLLMAFTSYARQDGGAAGIGDVNCRVLEVHASDSPAAVAVVFHQRDKQDQARFASLLVSHSGEKVQAQFGNGPWIDATVSRLKSCFGRGLLFLPSGAIAKERDTFVLRFGVASN